MPEHNETFKHDVLKCFNTAADEATEQIKQQVTATLAGVLGKFSDRVGAAKANATSIRERNQAILDDRVSKREVEEMVQRIEPRLLSVEQKPERLARYCHEPTCEYAACCTRP